MPTYYPYHSFNSAVHVTELNSKRTLCGVRPPQYWEMEFMGQVFPEIGDFEQTHKVSNGEGFYIGRWFACAFEFCPKCYQKLKNIKKV